MSRAALDPADTAPRRRLVAVLDWVILVLAVATVAIDLTGGFYTELAGLRISARRTDRAALAALAVLLVRLRLGRGIPGLGGRLAWLGRAARPAVRSFCRSGAAGAVRAGRLEALRLGRTGFRGAGCGAVAHAAGADELGARPRRSAVLDVANGLGLPSVGRRSAAAVRRQHLPSRAADPHVFRLDAACRR